MTTETSAPAPSPPPFRPPPPATPAVDRAGDAALIAQIAAEARASGQGVAFDPEAQPGDAPQKPGKAAKATAKPTVQVEDAEAEDAEAEPTEEAEPAASDGEAEAEGEGETDEAAPEAPSGEVDLDAVQKAMTALEGGVDIIELARALGTTPEALGVSPATHAAIRLQRRKAAQTLKRAEDLANKLQAEYGDRVEARKGLSQEGDLDKAIACVEAIFDMSWNDLNKAIAAKLQGKPLPDFETKRELAAAKKREAEREAADKKAADERAAAEKTARAKDWIASKISKDKLATADLSKLLTDAGFPSVVDLVFEEMQRGYSKGLTNPLDALERVRGKLQKQARALQTAGLLPGAQKPKAPSPVAASKPRAQAQAGAAGNARPMTDKEMREAVLKEAGLIPARR